MTFPIRALGVLVLLWGAGTLPAQDFAFSTKVWDDPSLENVGGKVHHALGYATLTLGASSLVFDALDKPGGAFLGQAAAVTAGSALGLGLLTRFGKLTFQGDLNTWHNLHALSGVLGTTLVASAPAFHDRSWGRTALGTGLGILLLGILLEG